jgi:hypothetical protein
MKKPGTNNALLEFALTYAQKGRPVFPCKITKEPRVQNGFKSATTDPAQIRVWWGKWPDASIGVPMGTETGWVALDVDPRHGGDKSLAIMMEQHGPLPATLHSHTGGGGDHFFFNTRGLMIATGELAPGLEIRAEGAYAIFPPSQHPSGNRYSWANEGKTEISDLPLWLEQLLKDRKPLSANNGDAETKKIPKGQRNPWLFRRACGYRNKGDDNATILAKLKIDNERCDPPYPGYKLRDIADRVAKRYAPSEEPATGDAQEVNGPPPANIPRSPFATPALAPLPPEDPPPQTEPQEPERIPGRLPITEMSNAERLIRKHGEHLRYAYERRVWCAWRENIWYVDDGGEVMRYMDKIAREIYFEAANESDEDLRKLLSGWAKRSESLPVQKHSVELASHFRDVEVYEFGAVFDTDSHLFNLPNGTIELS